MSSLPADDPFCCVIRQCDVLPSARGIVVEKPNIVRIPVVDAGVAKANFYVLREGCASLDLEVGRRISDLESTPEDLKLTFTKARARSHEMIIVSPFSPWFEVFGREMSAAERAIAEAISEEMMQHVLETRSMGQSFGIPIVSAGPDDIISHVIQQYLKAKHQGKAQL